MFKLRDGSKVKDKRLARIYQYDPRNKKFLIKRLIKATEPRSYTWRCNLMLDQGNDGSCVGCGITAELAARPAEVQKLNYRFAKEKIYWEAQRNDEWSGGSYPGAKPFYEGTSVLAGVKVAHSLGYFKGYYWADTFKALQMGMAYHGPAVIGINWYEGMFNMQEDGFIYPTGSIAGGHCCLLTQINMKEEYFTLHNSWGDGWADMGAAKISFKTMRRLLAEEGEAVFFVNRKSKL